MKGRFTIEWLSQSSQAAAAGPGLGDPCTSGTPPESLPGLYCSRERVGSETQHRDHRHQRTLAPQHPEPTPGHVSNPSSSSSSQATEPGFSSSTEEETSGYESEGERSLSPATPRDTHDTSPAAGRRPRTAFTVEQINRLEKAFKKNAYLGTHDKAELCRKLNLSDKQIRNWFQNRRMKLKRTMQDTLAQACQAKMTSQLLHYPQLQAFGPVPHPGYYPAQDSPTPYAPPFSLHYLPSPVGGAPISTDPLYHQYSSLPSLFTAAGSATLTAPHYYPTHY
ncbi:homeobox protein vent1-like [Anguilla anguilla]|uniref:homeobox protein vent1-like n=1 Tax=Anguilla anguilla TaxID=7936 RepID=UPI0015B307F5|nr:homeobox protein vent1-like [Anguilla anguilla]